MVLEVEAQCDCIVTFNIRDFVGVEKFGLRARRVFTGDRRKMSTLSLRLPESLHKQLRELAKKEGVSINQLATSALGEKIAALMTEDYLEQRAPCEPREV